MQSDRKFFEQLPLWQDRPFEALAATIAFAGLSLVLRLLCEPLFPHGAYPFVTFFPAVILSAFLFGVRNGVVAAILCGLFASWFFVAPVSGYGFTGGSVAAMLLYAFVVGTELAIIGGMQRAYANLAAERMKSERLAETRSLMFAELQHRVSNNLQMVGALLNLQRKDVTDPAATAALDEAVRRLSVVGKISRSLYSPAGGPMGLDVLLTRLCHDVLDASGRDDIAVHVTADGAPTVEPDAAVPVALIVAEAVSNAIEHGFSEGRGGRIDVRVKREDSSVNVSISDDGRGLPEEFDIEKTQSLGLSISRMLARHLGGEFILTRDRGTTAQLSFAMQRY